MRHDLLRLLIFPLGLARCFDLVREHVGQTFFDDWDFYGNWDNLTSGDVNYLTAGDAVANQLVGTNGAGNVLIRVDNFTNVPFNYKRNSIRITSKDSYDFGSLWVFDIVHLPYGCSVWPSIWTHGINWPVGGEIDIVEGINLQQTNQVALHTLPGCMHTTTEVTQTGTFGDLNCSVPAGCTVQDKSGASFGAQFAQAGGGVWATQFDVAGVFVWFWTRSSVPPSLAPGAAHQTLDISSWGPPVAAYPSAQGTCNMTNFFTAQQLVIDITLCGVWAGVPSIYNATCAGHGPTGMCYNDNVIGPGSPKYDQAYFEIGAVRAYTTGAPTATATGAKNTSSTGAAVRREGWGALMLGVFAGVVGGMALVS